MRTFPEGKRKFATGARTEEMTTLEGKAPRPYRWAMDRRITLTVTAKGQVTLKQAVLRHLGIKPGDTVVVDLGPERDAVIRAAPGATIDAFFSCLPSPDRSVSLEEMEKAITAGWAGKR